MLCVSGFELYSRWVPLKGATGSHPQSIYELTVPTQPMM